VNWNERFQQLFDARPPSDAPAEHQLAYDLKLSALTRHFISTAQSVGKVIIDEVLGHEMIFAYKDTLVISSLIDEIAGESQINQARQRGQ